MATDEEILNIRIGADPKDAIKAVQKLEKAFSSRMKEVEKGTLGVSKSIDKYISKLGDSKKAFNPVLKQQLKMYDQLSSEIDKASKEINTYVGEIKNLDASIAALEGRQESASGSQLKAIKEEIAATKKMRTEKSKSLKAATSGKASMEEGRKKIEDIAKQAKTELEIDPKLLPAAMKEAGEVFTSPFKAFIKKDFSGALAGGKHLAKSGAAIAGKGMQGTGGGGMSKALGGISKVFAKIGPMLGLMGSAITSLVKLFIDAESAAKDYQKQVLQTASTSGYLADNFNDVGLATAALESDLKDLRDGAMDWSNVQWGISKETAAAFQSALFAEGVAMNKLGEETQRATGYAQSHAQVIQMSVAYSRAFGVSLNEITQLQGEMMTEIGMGADAVQTSFQAITEGANEAGVTSGKFFGMVRSFSSDLSLFTLRIQELTKVMGVLGKTMAPREAQKFMQDMTGKFKGDLDGNLRSTVIAGGGKTRDIAKADVDSKMAGLMGDVASKVGSQSANELKTIMEDPKRDPKALAQWQNKHQKDLNGAMVSSIHDAVFALDMLAKGGSINTAAILGSLSPLAKRDLAQQESMRLIGKRIENASDLELMKLIKVGVVDNIEQVKSFAKLDQAERVKQEEILGKLVSKGGASAEELKRLSDAFGVQVTNGEESAKRLREMMDAEGGRTKLWNSLNKSEQELLDKSKDQIDYQKETSKFQTSSMDQLGIIADILMNQIYNSIMGVWNAIVSSSLFGDDKSRMTAKASQLKDPRAVEAIKKAFASGKGMHTARNEIVESVGKETIAKIQKGVKEYEDLKGKVGSAKGTKKEGMEARMRQLAPLLQHKDVTSQDLYTKEIHRPGGGFQRINRDPLEMLDSLTAMSNAVSKAGVKGGMKAGGSSTPTGGPAAAAGASPKEGEALSENQQATTESINQVDKTLKKGVALAKPSQGYVQSATDSTLSAIRKGLFEYYMYSSIAPDKMMAFAQQGMDPMQAALGMAGASAEAGSVEGGYASLLSSAKKGNARGGVVSGLAGSMAKVNSFPSPPAGEGWAAVRPGETIGPNGGGGGGKSTVELRLKGDLGKFIDARVIDGTAEFHRNRRLR